MPAKRSAAALALSDLRRAQPADTTLQNLLGLMSSKLELCGRLPIYAYEASLEGHRSCAAAFHDLADTERESFYALTECLRTHLDETVTPTSPGSTRAPVTRHGEAS